MNLAMEFLITGPWGAVWMMALLLTCAVVFHVKHPAAHRAAFLCLAHWLCVRYILSTGTAEIWPWIALNAAIVVAMSWRAPDAIRAVSVWYFGQLTINTFGLFCDVSGEAFAAVFDALGYLGLITLAGAAYDDGTGIVARTYRRSGNGLSGLLRPVARWIQSVPMRFKTLDAGADIDMELGAPSGLAPLK